MCPNALLTYSVLFHPLASTSQIAGKSQPAVIAPIFRWELEPMEDVIARAVEPAAAAQLPVSGIVG
jgi:hypothetical protein